MKVFEQLQGVGALASTELVRKSVKMPNGAMIDVHVREIPEAEIGAIFRQDDGKQRARLINAGLREPDGKIAITVEQAGKLLPIAAQALQSAIMEVNSKADNKDFEGNSESEASSGSGTSSPATSDEPSES